MANGPITKRTVDAATPSERDYFIWDSDGRDVVKGFGLKVTPSGGRTYVFQYRIERPGDAKRPPAKRYTIGAHGKLTPDQARSQAKALAALVEQGIDPRQRDLDRWSAEEHAARMVAEKARLDGELAFEIVAAKWLAEYELEHRPTSFGQAKVSINKYLLPKLRGKPLPNITKTDLQAAIDEIPASRKASRQQVFAYASILFRWALERGDICDNPVSNMTKPKGPKPRDRVLSDEELASVWLATGNMREPLSAFYRLLLLTGQRRDEVAGMLWPEIDRATATWIIPANKAKNRMAHIVPLAPAVVEELDRLALSRQIKAKEAKPDAQRWPKTGPVISLRGDKPISCFSKAKTLLDAEVKKVCRVSGGLSPWRAHDLRRTLATGLQRLGVRFEVTEAVLNHISGAKSGVAGIYQRHHWQDEKRSALEAWGRHVAKITQPAHKDNVVALQKKTGAA